MSGELEVPQRHMNGTCKSASLLQVQNRAPMAVTGVYSASLLEI